MSRTTANKIRHIREGMDMTQQEFAHEIGVTQAAISQIEEGKRVPSRTTLEKISKRFNTSIDSILDIAVSNEDKEKDFVLGSIASKLKTLPIEKLFAIDRFLRSMIGG